MTTPSFFRKVRLFILSIVMPLTGLLAANESYVQSLTGHLKKGDSLTVVDDKFLNMPLEQWNQVQHLSVNDIITFELRHDTTLNYYTRTFTCTLNVTIKYFTSRDDQMPKEIDSVNLVVKYDSTKGRSYADMARYRFKNAFKVIVVINSINSPEWKDKLPDCFRLKGQIMVNRKYPFDGQSNGTLHLGAFEPVEPSDMVAMSGPQVLEPAGPAVDAAAVNGQLDIWWATAAFTGAEEFDLEWTFVDILSAWGNAIKTNYGGTTGPFAIPQAAESQMMLHNSTRVTVTSSPYSINLPYVEGYILVRIRSASYQTGTNLRVTGNWVYINDANNPSVAYLGPRQTTMNYQYTGSFAEGGKRKEVTTYFDGSQRSRQSVTVNNSDLTFPTPSAPIPLPTAVVQETIYDIMGRPTVNVLPAPMKSNLLDYKPYFNLNGSNSPYSFADITLALPTTSCAIAAVPMSTTSGASQYYSPSNSFLDTRNALSFYFNPYIPDAKQYPFSVTQYMPDNTGRIARQGGVGFTLQTGGANDTKYFYGKPTPTELLKMFGMEVGDPSHYLKNMIIDPNGQASLSFIDANGKTIATALAGGSPATMDQLPTANVSTAETPLNDVLVQPSDFTVDAGNLNMTATSTFLAETMGAFSVVYSLNPLALTTSYAGGASTLCNNCYYTVVIKVLDPCGNVLQNSSTTPFTVNDFTCHVNPPPITGTLGFNASQLGSYFISYSLQLSNDVINAQTNDYVATNTDLSTLQTFFDQQLNAMNLNGCYSSCDQCKTLGTLQNFQTQVQGLLTGSGFKGININDPTLQKWISTEYQTLTTQCASISCSAASPCDQKLQQLEQDVLPGGQYATYDPVALANNASTVFTNPQINVMELYNQDPVIKVVTFTAADGSTQQVGSLSQADFIRAYLQNPQWASLFVVHHIEYCSYLWCKDASYTPAADNNEVSYTFDATLQQNFTNGSDAVAAGYYNHADPLALLEKDPWFNGGRGASYYSNMSADLQNLTTALSIAPKDNTVNPATPLPVKNIIQWIDWSLYCIPASSSTTPAQFTASWNNCSPNANCRSVTMEWQLYLNYYMELKRKYYRIAKLAYFAAKPASAPNQGCLDCFIGTDPLSTAGCVPPDALSNYQVVHENSGGTCGYYVVYNNGNSPFAGNYAITYSLNGLGTSTTGTVNCNAGDTQVPIFTTQVSAGEDCAVSGSYQVTGVSCRPSALAACAAASPTTPIAVKAVVCPTASAFSLKQVNIVGPTPTPAPPAEATCDLTSFQEQLIYSGSALPVAVTVYVTGVQNGGTPVNYTVTMPAGQTTVLISNGQTFTNQQGDQREPVAQQCAASTWTFSIQSTAPVCAIPPPSYTQTPGPASTCTSNSNYALYSASTRVFNDYSDVQDYASCIGTSLSAGTQTAATASASVLQQAQANLTAQEANWFTLLQNVRSQTSSAIPAIGSVTDAQLTTLTSDLYNLSYTYLKIASAQNSAMNIVSSLPNPLPSGFTAPGGYYTFMAIFIHDVGSAAVNAGFGPDLLDNVYPYNKIPYPADLNVTRLTSDIFSNVSANLTAWQNAWTAGGSVGTFSAYLQAQLGDDYLLTPTQLSDLQTRVANGCTNPYLANPALLPVALVVNSPSGVTSPGGVNIAPVSSITCSQMTTLAASFQATYPSLPANSATPTIAQLYQIVYTNYLNHALGYPLSYADYNGFLTNTCPITSSAVIYDKPQTMSVVNNPFSCAAAALQQTYSAAGQAYTAYINQVRIQFRNAYVSKCLSNQASANITGNQYQYHYTLYYYDQSGNLVKTVPPEGVHLLSAQDVATIQEISTQTPGSCAVFPSTVVYNQATVLSQLSTALQSNSAQAMELWLFNNAGGTSREFRMVTTDNKYMVQAAVANGYLYFEVYALSPEASGLGIDMTLTNEAVATLPSQEVLQNWTHLMVQSTGGLNGGTLQLYIDGNKLTNVSPTSAPAYPFAWEIDGVTGGYTMPTTDVSQVQQLRLYNTTATDAQVTADFANSCLSPVGSLTTTSQQLLWGIFNSPTFCNNNTANTTPVSIGDRGALNITANPDPTGALNAYALTSVTNTFTVEFWVKPNAGVVDNIGNLNDIYAGVDYSPPYVIAPTYGGATTTGQADIGIAVGTNGITVFERAQNYLPALLDWRGTVTAWTHVAVVYNNKTPSLYVNGTLVATGNTSTKSLVSPSYNFGGGGYGWMAGGIDEVRIWNLARTQTQIAAAMDQALSPTDQTGLVGYWPMDATYGSMLHDVSCNGNEATFEAPAMTWSPTNTAPITETNYVPFASRFIVPNHGLPTNYAYNSLNQVTTQVTPDAGTSTFLYDRLGRLSISQNAEQKLPAVADSYNQAGRFSYTRYDPLGRIDEVGEKLGAATLAETDTRVDATLQTWYASGSNRMVTVTAYDAAPSWIPNGTIPANNQRKRVAATALLSAGSNPAQNRQAASYFSYDYDGNVAELVQENTSLINNEKQVVTGATGLKDIKYQYDLISGKVNEVLYQDGKWDQFYYQYIYDADNRLINAYTSRNNDPEISLWTNEATYRYYLHGPLARMELGANNVQGVDYAYTLQGWLKGINGQQLTGYQGPPVDMSGDGAPGTNFSFTGRDVLGLSLGYFTNDYIPIGGTSAAAFGNIYQAPATTTGQSGQQLFNGNISYTTYAINPLNYADNTTGFTGYSYRYDQLNRLTGMDAHNIAPYSGASAWDNTSITTNYQMRLSYDGNGNILSLVRNVTGPYDNLGYNYNRDASGNLLGNQLQYVTNSVPYSTSPIQPSGAVNPGNFKSQSPGNYTYDNNGNLIRDPTQNLGLIYWTVYGKMAQIYQGAAPANGGVYGTGTGLAYGYDPGGNRITKAVTASGGTGATTYYVRDAQGNVLAVYQYKTNSSGALTEGDWLEQHLYGSSRLGMLQPHVAILAGQALANDAYNSATDNTENAGNRQYELADHLGNVLNTINDISTPGDRYLNSKGVLTTMDNFANTITAQDYFPFGMEMPGRTYLSGSYRYGFNGKENDNEVEGIGNSIDYGARVYDPRAGRFLSVDPLTGKYPWYTPYQFAGNTPIQAIDLDGKEEYRFDLSNTKKNGLSISVLNLVSIKQYSTSNLFGQKYPGPQPQHAIVNYNDDTYHIGFTGDDPDAINIFNLWKQHPNADLFSALFPSDKQRNSGLPDVANAFKTLRDAFAAAILQAVPAGFKDFEPVQLKESRKGGKELNQEVKKISDGGGTPRLDDKGAQKTYNNNNSKYPQWKGAKEYEVSVDGRSNELRILKQEVGTDANGNPLYKYGWTDKHYETIYEFKTKPPQK